MRKALCLTIISLIASPLLAQQDSAKGAAADVFTNIMKGIETYQVDTTAAPDDRTTRVITQLRNLKGGFNISEAIDFKIGEDRRKGDMTGAQLDQLALFFKSGDGKRRLDNAVTWIYRKHFTYAELKQLVRFYKKPAGQKMATEFPMIMLQCLRAAEIIKTGFLASPSPGR